MSGVQDDIVIDVNDPLAKRLAELPTGAEPYTFPRVPAYIREKNKYLYEPKSIAIGPYHHGRSHLQATEQKKLRFLRDLLKRATTIARLEQLREKMVALEKEARDSYRENISLNSDEFVEMMVLDACFIIEFFLKLHDGDGKLPVEVGLWGTEFIDMDLLLLENQIPFFVIRELFRLIVDDGNSGASAKNGKTLPIATLLSLLYKYMKIGTVDKPRETVDKPRETVDKPRETVDKPRETVDKPRETVDKPRETQREPPDEIHHLLHLYYHWFLPDDNNSGKLSPKNPKETSNPAVGQPFSNGIVKPGKKEDLTLAYVIPCASELRDAGVRFKRKKAPRHMLDITFNNGVIEMPPIPILEITKPFFANFVAFEQSIHQKEMKMASFSLLMDSLINTEKDVGILQRCDIIDNTLGSEQEMAVFFNQLGEYAEFAQVENYFSDLFKKVNSYRNNLWYKHRERLCHDYFSSPWSTVSLIGASILFILTFLQTFFAVYEYFHK